MRFLILALFYALVAVVCASPFLGAVQDFERRGGGKGGRGKMLEKLCASSDVDIAKMEPKCACIPPPFSSGLALISSVVAKMHAMQGR